MQATPYLRKWFPRLPQVEPDLRLAVDLGCGNGRNSEYLRARGYDVHSYDLEPDYAHAQPWRAGQRLPYSNEFVSLVLCQYVLMFLTDVEIACTLNELNRIVRPEGHIIIELQSGVCASRTVNLDRVLGYLAGAGAWNQNGCEWATVHFAKECCILEKRSLIQDGIDLIVSDRV
jgi:SAM-dependent methyltransferase